MILLRKRQFHGRTGGILAASLIMVTLIATLGAGLIRLQTIVTRRHVQSVDKKRALYVAEAGVAEAFAAISLGKSGNVGTAQKPAAFGGGVYWVEAEDIDDERVRLNCNGLCGIGRFSITVVVRRSVNPIGIHGSFGRRGIEVGNRSVIDGFDSRTGTYAQQIDTSLPQASTGLGARLTSNKDIEIEGGFVPTSVTTFIYGDARPGPKGVVSADPGVEIDGSTAPLGQRVALPPLVIPDITSSQGNLDVYSLMGPVVVGGSELRYDRILAKKGSELILQGPLVLVTSILVLRENSRLVIDSTNGPVTVHVTDALAFEAHSTLENVTGDSTQVGLFLGDLEGDEVWTRKNLGTDYELDGGGALAMPTSSLIDPPRLVFNAGGEFTGLIYAPFSELTIPDDLRVMGAIAAKRVTFESDSHFTFDKALESTGAGIDSLPRLLTWRIDDLPNIPLVKIRIDPMVALTLAGVTPKRSSRAHKEFSGELRYIDTDGNPQIFLGDIDTFSWVNVKKVDTVRWEDPVTTILAPPKVPVGNYTSESLNSVTIVPF